MKPGGRLDRALLLTGIGGFLPLGATAWWGLELLTHFRLQYLVPATAMLLLAIALRRRFATLLLVTAVAINAWPLLPYVPAASASQAEPLFDILSVNVNSSNQDFDAITELLESRPFDLVAILELTPELDRHLESIAAAYPHRLSRPANGNFGIAILSRLPLIGADSFALDDDIGLDAVVETRIGRVHFIAVHLLPPVGAAMAHSRNRQLIELATYVSAIEDSLIVCGDFNLSPYSPYFRDFTHSARMTDTRRGRGFDFSWPSSMPLLGTPIDHCLIRGPLTVASIARLAPTGSDHYPLHVTLFAQDNE